MNRGDHAFTSITIFMTRPGTTIALFESKARIDERAQCAAEISTKPGTFAPVVFPIVCSNSVATGPGQTCVAVTPVPTSFRMTWLMA